MTLYLVTQFLLAMMWALLALGLFQNLLLLIQLPAAWRELKSQSQTQEAESTWRLATGEAMPSVSLIIPAYNEQAAIAQSVRSMFSLRYPDFEIIVVNDGSRDATLQTLIDSFQLVPAVRVFRQQVPCTDIRQLYESPLDPRLLVIDKLPGGCKADASNAGLNHARKDLVCVIDADSLLEEDSLTRAVRPFMEDETMVAVGGTIRILNGCQTRGGRVTRYGLPRRFLPLLQVMEYQRAFLGARLALSRWKVLTLISGAFSLFRRDVAVACGGFGTDTVGEDYDLVMKMHRHMIDGNKPYAMRYLADTVCWTESPEDLRSLSAQRRRWQLGGLQVFMKHRDMFFNKRYGRVGWVSMPLALVADVLGPMGELAGWVLVVGLSWLGQMDWRAGAFFTAIVLLTGVMNTYLTLLFDVSNTRWKLSPRQQAVLLLAAVAEGFGYRQINNWWRVRAFWMYLRKQSAWGNIHRMKRVG
jgi:cellulose synthase/poly-beta-1,6-N-acetylglucosamine synthase-like glycosyltransferase